VADDGQWQFVDDDLRALNGTVFEGDQHVHTTTCPAGESGGFVEQLGRGCRRRWFDGQLGVDQVVAGPDDVREDELGVAGGIADDIAPGCSALEERTVSSRRCDVLGQTGDSTLELGRASVYSSCTRDRLPLARSYSLPAGDSGRAKAPNATETASTAMSDKSNSIASTIKRRRKAVSLLCSREPIASHSATRESAISATGMTVRTTVTQARVERSTTKDRRSKTMTRKSTGITVAVTL
jgi:hypothetical protein